MNINSIKIVAGALLLSLFITNNANAQDKLYPNEFPLSDVTLLDGPFKHARDLNLQVLLKYDVDRLLAPYRKEAGLPEKAKSYPNWDGLDGHVGGHYLSAMAMYYAALGNAECKKRMDYMISELKACQEANAKNNPAWGVGYVGGVPKSAELWSKIKEGNAGVIWSAWAPWYNIHKMYAGLRDAWLYAGNEEAKNLFLKFCDWGIDVTSNLSDAKMEEMLGNEHGGMNEMYADAYQMTRDEKYLTAAKRFSHKAFLDPLSQGNDVLDNQHANTQIPKFIGFERIAELSHDEKYQKAASFFWETVTQNRSLAFGGNSRREHFPSVTSCIDFVTVNDGPESCNSYNMLKLTEDVFRMRPLAKYADYYERTILNHILSTQHPEHGGYVYFTSARPRHYRVYSAPNEAMWCCVGTGMENHGKYNQFIYTRSKDTLYVNLFIASELNWKEKGLKIKQETKFPFEEQTQFSITEGSGNFKLMLRHPSWVRKGELKISVNGKDVKYTVLPSNYINIERNWKKGDKVKVLLPMHNHIEHLPNVPEYVAFMHGPILLGAKTGTEDLKGLIADDGRWGQYAGGEYLPVDKAPILVYDDIENIAQKLVPVKGKPLNFKLDVKMVNPMELTLEPFYQIHDARYMMYWLALTNSGYKAYTDSLTKIETAKLELEKRTIDYVMPGEQQPETDHAMQVEKSNKGNNMNEFFREARDGGYFSYDLATNGETNLSLFVRYWGAEWGSRKFDIYIDNEKLVSEDNSNRWNLSQFQNIVYPIPDSMVKGKKHIRVKFQAAQGSTAGAVYVVRLLRAGETKSPASKESGTSNIPAPRVVEDGGTGLYSAIMYTDSTLLTHTIFRPKDLSVFGHKTKLPIIAWGNGACANSPWEHINFLSEVASHGFLVIAIGPMPKEGERGGGRSTSSQLIDAINWAIAQNSNKASVFYNKIDVSKIAVSGMSCGGLQTLETAPDPRVTTAVICNSGIIGNGGGMSGMPALTKDHLAKLHTPTLYLLGGEKDIAYKNGMDDFSRINHVPVFVANMDVGHGGTYSQPHGGEFAKVATAWFKWQLKGDKEAAKMFTGNPCQLSKSTVWKVEKKNLP